MFRVPRRTALRLALSTTVLSMLGISTLGCGGGGSSGGGGGGTNPPPPTPPPGGGSTSVLQATINNGASVRTSPINFPNGTLVNGVNQTQGDLNYNVNGSWQGQASNNTSVSTGTGFSWFVNGQGSGSPQSFTAR